MNMRITGDKPAFPCETLGVDEHGEYRAPYSGMSLRDYFATAAMNGVISGTEIDLTPEHIAKAAYAVADAMLKERDKS